MIDCCESDVDLAENRYTRWNSYEYGPYDFRRSEGRGNCPCSSGCALDIAPLGAQQSRRIANRSQRIHPSQNTSTHSITHPTDRSARTLTHHSLSQAVQQGTQIPVSSFAPPIHHLRFGQHLAGGSRQSAKHQSTHAFKDRSHLDAFMLGGPGCAPARATYSPSGCEGEPPSQAPTALAAATASSRDLPQRCPRGCARPSVCARLAPMHRAYCPRRWPHSLGSRSPPRPWDSSCEQRARETTRRERRCIGWSVGEAIRWRGFKTRAMARERDEW